MQGWIKLHRVLIDKPIWQNSTPEQCKILVTLLMMANHKESEWEWQGKTYKAKPGQFVTSLDSIVKKCGTGITTRNIRTAIQRFEKYEFLTNQSTNKNRLITIVNWEQYQDFNSLPVKDSDKQVTSDRQAPDKHVTTNKNDKECIKNDKNDKDDYENSESKSNDSESPKKTQSSVFLVYQNEIGILTGMIADEIGAWLDDGMSEDVIIKAIEISAMKNRRNWKHTEGILRNWYNQNLKTLSAVEAHEKEFEKQRGEKRGKNNSGNSKPNRINSSYGYGRIR